ncbi:hypothetical protein EVAR_5720_1 [Eumeta japonica]|uniref:Uncharacterized protein n=1 Tax=Eumeta variegata TaxID=151549 RepID=A0A4C1T7C5_EUMVA|nr:hypothetical protein EVAR_5720_1 [Eumeta japonica]
MLLCVMVTGLGLQPVGRLLSELLVADASGFYYDVLGNLRASRAYTRLTTLDLQHEPVCQITEHGEQMGMSNLGRRYPCACDAEQLLFTDVIGSRHLSRTAAGKPISVEAALGRVAVSNSTGIELSSFSYRRARDDVTDVRKSVREVLCVVNAHIYGVSINQKAIIKLYLVCILVQLVIGVSEALNLAEIRCEE